MSDAALLDRIRSAFVETAHRLARQTPEVQRRPYREQAVAEAMPALATDDFLVVALGFAKASLADKETALVTQKDYYERQLAKERHDREYWQGRAPQAVDEIREQAAALAERAKDPRLAAAIRGLRIEW